MICGIPFNPFTTGNPFLGTNILIIGRGSRLQRGYITRLQSEGVSNTLTIARLMNPQHEWELGVEKPVRFEIVRRDTLREDGT